MARYLNSAWYDEASTNNFWMKWRFHIIKNLILRFNIKANKVLDVGCGQGTFAEQYNDYFKKKITGCDINLNIKKGIKKNKINYINYDISKKNKKYKEFFDLVFILDVIEHVGNDKKFLNDCYFHLKKNGFIIINVPAFQILFSKYDCAVGHKRRYNKKTLLNIIDDKKFKVLDLRYWGLFLMPLLIIRKIITNYFFNKSNKKKIIEFGWTTNGLRNIFLQIIALEKFFPLNFFFGSSLTSILIKK
jgi:2-polyprenyl-3-methyl-5-hydroxy-6-metoxy-1,4-benzoquinol methylase